MLDDVTTSLPFSLWDITYGTHGLDTNDLTNLFLPGDSVALTARVERKPSGRDHSPGPGYWYRVIDVARVSEERQAQTHLEEGFGTVVAVSPSHGILFTSWATVESGRLRHCLILFH